MNLTSLRYFLVLTEELNFRRAAAKLFLSEQTLSATIRKMEKELDVPLFERRPHTRLTLGGESLLRHAREMLRIESHLISELADISEHASGALRVGINQVVAHSFFPGIWERFHTQYPNIHLTLIEDSTIHLDERLRKGDVDLYIGINAQPRNDTETLPLAKESICCIYSNSFLQRASAAQRAVLLESQRQHCFDLTDIELFPLVTFTPVSGLRQMFESFFMKHDLHPRIILETDKHNLISKVCRMGAGIAIIYRMVFHDLAEQPDTPSKLNIIPVKNKMPLRRTSLVYRKDSYVPRFMRGFIEIAKEVVQECSQTAVDAPLLEED